MAKSTFHYFRKHTKVAVVFLGALCMLAFVVADPLMQYLNDSQGGGSGSRRGDIAVSWKGGELTEGQLGALVARRQVLAGFLMNLQREGQYMAMEAGVPAEVPTRVAPLNLPTDRRDNVEQDVLQSKIFAEAARRAGMVVSDQTIVDYLEALGRDYVSRDRMRDMINGISLGNGRATPEFMFGLLREALLARDYVASYAYSRATVLPEQRWEDWLKVNDRVVIETAELPVEDFVAEVKEPTEEQIAEFYEEHKNDVPGMVIVENTQMPSPSPGFRTPAKAKVQYLRGDFAAATEEAAAGITEEEIAEFYEENKEMFEKSELDLISDDDDAVEIEEEMEVAPAEDDETQLSEESPTADEKGEGAGNASEQDEQLEAPPSPDASESGAADRRGRFQLAAYQAPADDADKGDVAEESVDESSDDSETDASPGEPSEGANDPLEEFMQAGDGDESDTEGGAADQPAEGEVEGETKVVEYQPLEEVKEEIRQRLAQEKAAGELNQKLQDLLGILRNDYNGYFTARIDAEAAEQPLPDPPEALIDWAKLAKDNDLEFGESELLSFFEFNESPLGELRQPIDQAPTPPRLSVQVFRNDGLELYEPAFAFDLEQNQYLVMKVAFQPEATPKLEEIRDQVVAAWKREQAADLALSKAKQLAEQTESSGKSLKEQFDGDDNVRVQESDRFGWLEPFTVTQYGEQDLRLGRPGSVEGAGPEFMKEVFSLEPSEIGATLNYGRNAAYVIRVALRESSLEELRQDFLRDWNDPRLRRANDRKYIAETARAVFFNLIGGEAPDWKRPPDSEPVETE